MKNIIIYILFLFPFSTFGQTPDLPIDTDTYLITYTAIDTVNGTQNELYLKAKEWFSETYNSSNAVIQMDEKSTEMVGKAVMHVYYHKSGHGYIHYTISVYFKDGRYKYLITDLYHTGESRSGGYFIGNVYYPTSPIPGYGPCENMMVTTTDHEQKIFNSLLNQMNDQIISLVNDLQQKMRSKSQKDF
jgi:hypothetical protein